MTDIPQMVKDAILMASDPVPEDSVEVRGYDFSDGVNYRALLDSFRTTGFQATHFGRAVEEINEMIKKKLEPIPEPEDGVSYLDDGERPIDNCTIFLGFTSNMISSGVRESIKYLLKNNMVDCIVTTTGGIEEDLMKCMAPSYLGDFSLRGAELRKKGINRIGNLIVPNTNYCMFEQWILPIWDKMLEEQNTLGTKWTPSKVIARLGKEINNPDSVWYWAYKNNIPVFSPALTDGAIGDTLYFQSYKNPGIIIDIVEDVKRMNNTAVYAKNTGMIILGGGLIKHHICNANMMRNGADFSVFVNTGQEFDGSDAGARPDEAVSWGKIKSVASPVKVYADATLVFPLLVAETFARNFKTSK
ncbi:deoxyhypusine synthase-like isoform X2 [Montipora foliosa]|uniref:deoxyhypusine synthase-like isoform X1 n=1 Tax=Montipora foliosa TaxID=591990 RepID=UPI0035F13C28